MPDTCNLNISLNIIKFDFKTIIYLSEGSIKIEKLENQNKQKELIINNH